MSAAAPFPSKDRRPLGEVLVERGIVTSEQLTIALEQQRTSGRQLGEIIVGLGFAPGPIVAQALATQHGGLMKTEYGFATGWSTDDTPQPVAAASPTAASELADRDRLIAELRTWSESAQAAISSRDDVIAHLRADLAGNGVREEALAALRAELATELERHAAEIARLEATGADLISAAAAREAELAHAREAQATAEHELAAARRARTELERRLENARSRADTLARRITEREDELEALRAPAPATAEPSRWASAPMHYVLRRGAGGYDLIAYDGPPPVVGESVDGLRVARVAPAGPGFDVPCAYLAD